jgi:LPXTG-motif cell wall-anchored protein
LDTISTATNVTIKPGDRLHYFSAAESKHSGLSTGVKSAIGVMVGVARLAIILGAVFFIKRRRKRQ